MGTSFQRLILWVRPRQRLSVTAVRRLCDVSFPAVTHVGRYGQSDRLPSLGDVHTRLTRVLAGLDGSLLPVGKLRPVTRMDASRLVVHSPAEGHPGPLERERPLEGEELCGEQAGLGLGAVV